MNEIQHHDKIINNLLERIEDLEKLIDICCCVKKLKMRDDRHKKQTLKLN